MVADLAWVAWSVMWQGRDSMVGDVAGRSVWWVVWQGSYGR